MCDSIALSCCPDKTIVQDKVCTNFQLTAAGTQIIYVDNIAQIISGTGYVSNEIGTASITVNFLNNAVVVNTLVIPAGGSASFTIRRFDTISVVATTATQGEFCITVRYNL